MVSTSATLWYRVKVKNELIFLASRNKKKFGN